MEALFWIFVVIAVFLFLKKRKKKGSGSLAASISIAPDKKLFKKAGEPLYELIKSYIPFMGSKDIAAIQKMVMDYTGSGYRPEAISKHLVEKFHVPPDIAPTVSHHSVSLLMSKYNEYKLAEIGIYKYRWGHGHSGRNGCQHAFLNGKVFEFSNPPIIDKSGTRANPGESYPCVCMAIAQFD